MQKLLSDYDVTAVTELTLGANQELSEAQRLEWNIENKGTTNGSEHVFVFLVTISHLILEKHVMK